MNRSHYLLITANVLKNVNKNDFRYFENDFEAPKMP